jgi:hypothetical protein
VAAIGVLVPGDGVRVVVVVVRVSAGLVVAGRDVVGWAGGSVTVGVLRASHIGLRRCCVSCGIARKIARANPLQQCLR